MPCRIRENARMRGLLRAIAPVLGCFIVACGPPPKPIVPDDKPVSDDKGEDKGVDAPRAKAILARAEAALTKKDYEEVRKLCDQADPYADEGIREDIRQLLQRTDGTIAKDLTPPILELAKGGQCQKAAEKVVEAAEANKGTAVIRFVKDEVSKPTLECLLKALEIDVSVARELAEVTAIKKALNPDDFTLWDQKLDEATVGTLVVALQEPINKRNWAQAVKQLDDMVTRKEAGPNEVARVMKVVRAGIAEDVEKKANDGIGKKVGAGTLLKDIDALLAVGRWQPDKDDAAPEMLLKRRGDAAFWAVCAAQDCNMVGPTLNWAYGLLEVKPLLDLSGQLVTRVKHARQVWRIAEGRGFALVADHDPGPLDSIESRIPAALGWVPIGGLSPSDTSERLPPGDALVGTTVWGGFRDKTQWELGVVRVAAGENLDVERVADGKTVKARRSEIRFGTLKAGTKVLTLCAHPIKMETATIDEVVPMNAGDPHVKLTCLDDKGSPTELKREVLLGSLRTQPAWLPPGR